MFINQITVALLIVYLSYATFGLNIKDEIIADAPPIAKWAIGKNWIEVGKYYRGKKAEFKLIN